MTTFRAMVSVAVLSLAICGNAYGQTTESTTQYREALKQCGADWKASAERKGIEKGKGMQAWQEFRAKCVKEKGWNGNSRRPSTKQQTA